MSYERTRPIHTISRRKFLHLSMLAAAGAVAVACVPVEQAAAPATQEQTTLTDSAVPGQQYNEAPQLADLVRAGELTPVDDRLPAAPMVVEPVERVGRYGGTWRSGLVGGG